MKNAASVFFVGFPGVRVSGKQCKCMDTCFFAPPPGRQKCLLGLLPKPAVLLATVTRCVATLREK